MRYSPGARLSSQPVILGVAVRNGVEVEVNLGGWVFCEIGVNVLVRTEAGGEVGIVFVLEGSSVRYFVVLVVKSTLLQDTSPMNKKITRNINAIKESVISQFGLTMECSFRFSIRKRHFPPSEITQELLT